MSISAPTISTSSLSGSSPLPGVPVVDQANEPAAVRRGGQEAKKAYDTGLGFESMLVSELAQSMTATLSGSDSSDPSSSGSSDPGAGSGSGLGAYSSLLPNALSSSIMSAGGTGVAMQIAESIDPKLAGFGKST